MSENVKKLYKILDNLERDVRYAKKLLIEVQQETRKDYSQVPGDEGVYDGFHLVKTDGTKIEVPANYAAKSRLVWGDTLKMIEEEGKKLFKQIAKSPRKRVEGVLNKKEGKWYVLAETGSYRVSDVAVDFNNLQIGDKVTILIPENNLNAPFATLDVKPAVIKKVAPEITTDSKPIVKKVEVPVGAKTPAKEPVKKVVPAKSRSTSASSSDKPVLKGSRKPAVKKADTQTESAESKEYVNQIGVLGDDDLR